MAMVKYQLSSIGLSHVCNLGLLETLSFFFSKLDVQTTIQANLEYNETSLLCNKLSLL